MEKITAFFVELDFAEFVPEMGSLLELVRSIASTVIVIGPIVMLLLGLWYFFLPPKEANHSVGFRTYFGMGSVEAWRFTQKIAGAAWCVIGLVLTIVMFIVRSGYAEKDIMDAVTSAIVCLLWQAGLALVSYILVCLIATICFDRKGNRRFDYEHISLKKPPQEHNPDDLYKEDVYPDELYTEEELMQESYPEPYFQEADMEVHSEDET